MPAPRVTSNSPWHLVFVLDDSESMTGAAANTLNQALDEMLEEMKLLSQGTKPYFKISVIVFGSHVKVIAEAESEQTLDKAKVTSFSGTSGTRTWLLRSTKQQRCSSGGRETPMISIHTSSC